MVSAHSVSTQPRSGPPTSMAKQPLAMSAIRSLPSHASIKRRTIRPNATHRVASGNGEAKAANKVPGIRAALCYSEEITRLARAHNDANVMSLGGRFTDPELANRMMDIFLETPFDGGRHKRRVEQIET